MTHLSVEGRYHSKGVLILSGS